MIPAAPRPPIVFAMLWVKLTNPSFTVDKTDLDDDVCGAESPVCTTSCSIVGVKALEESRSVRVYRAISGDAALSEVLGGSSH